MTPSPRFVRWWWTGLRGGFGALIRSRSLPELRHALRVILCPIDLWRYYELAAIVRALDRPAAVLDVGSPKIIATILQREFGTRIVGSDIARDALTPALAGQSSVQCDAIRLPFPDGSFPCVLSVSTVEHIGGEGDTEAIREIARVLAPGGILVLTVPLVPAYFERWVDSDPYGKQARNARGRVFFSRYYDWSALRERILRPHSLRVENALAWQEKRTGWYSRYCAATARPASPRSIVVKLCDAVWAAARIESVDGGPENLSRHGLAAIIFRKGAADGSDSGLNAADTRATRQSSVPAPTGFRETRYSPSARDIVATSRAISSADRPSVFTV